MDKQALIQRRRQLERQRDAAVRACRAKWRSRINSVDRLLDAATTPDGTPSRTKPGQARPIVVFANALEGKVNGDRKKGVMIVVRQTLRHNRGFFTARSLVALINETTPCSVTVRDISHPLWSLHKLGVIRLVEKGNGRKPHMYLKP